MANIPPKDQEDGETFLDALYVIPEYCLELQIVYMVSSLSRVQCTNDCDPHIVIYQYKILQ